LFHIFNQLEHNIKVALTGVWMSLLWKYLVQPLRSSKEKVENYLRHRQDAFDEAAETFQEGRNNNTIQRHELYDLYCLPSKLLLDTTTTKQQQQQQQQQQHALLFLPGALVDRTAYSVIFSKLCKKYNIIVAVVNNEPMRLPMHHLGANVERIQTITKSVQELLNLPSLTWTLGGHSMGGYAASECIMKLQRRHKLVMWGGGPVSKAFVRADDLPMLSIVASNDKIATSPMKQEQLPKSARIVTIQGGNHSGFAHFGPQMFPRMDGERTISLEEQQEQVIQATVSFILDDDDDDDDGSSSR
jgi:hypothetical protein